MPWLPTATRHPGVIWAAHVGALWFWHASLPYEAALRHDAVHIAEHATFLITGALFWGLVVRPTHPRSLRGNSAAAGFAVLLLFTMALQGVFLSVLLTFARTPWYSEYSTTTSAWGLGPLADQQLAGAIMWVPAGAIYVGAGVLVLALWLRSTERDSTSDDGDRSLHRGAGAGSRSLHTHR